MNDNKTPNEIAEEREETTRTLIELLRKAKARGEDVKVPSDEELAEMGYEFD